MGITERIPCGSTPQVVASAGECGVSALDLVFGMVIAASGLLHAGLCLRMTSAQPIPGRQGIHLRFLVALLRVRRDARYAVYGKGNVNLTFIPTGAFVHSDQGSMPAVATSRRQFLFMCSKVHNLTVNRIAIAIT